MQNGQCKMFNADDGLGIFHFALNILHFAFVLPLCLSGESCLSDYWPADLLGDANLWMPPSWVIK